MAYTASKLIEIALAEVGYLEKASNSQLDDKTANAGSKNYTKYARDLANAGYYQASKQGFAWCDMFVDWCHLQAANGDKKVAEDTICQIGLYGAGCGYSMNYYKEAGRFYTSNPQVGDQIFFGSASSVDHTGIVYKVDGSKVYTVEGNTSGTSGVVANGGGVFKKSYTLTNKKIRGYGRPRYAVENQTNNTTNNTTTNTTTSKGVCKVELPILKNGSTGANVKALQMLLIGYGYSCGRWGADGSFGDATESALRAYQTKKKLQIDGKCGPESWNSLLGN